MWIVWWIKQSFDILKLFDCPNQNTSEFFAGIFDLEFFLLLKAESVRIICQLFNDLSVSSCLRKWSFHVERIAQHDSIQSIYVLFCDVVVNQV